MGWVWVRQSMDVCMAETLRNNALYSSVSHVGKHDAMLGVRISDTRPMNSWVGWEVFTCKDGASCSINAILVVGSTKYAQPQLS